jgi:gallate dioxygenase
MARLVTGIGVPHTPFFPGIAKQQGDSSRMVQLFKRVRQELESAKPDLIVMLTTDHFSAFSSTTCRPSVLAHSSTPMVRTSCHA